MKFLQKVSFRYFTLLEIHSQFSYTWSMPIHQGWWRLILFWKQSKIALLRVWAMHRLMLQCQPTALLSTLYSTADFLCVFGSRTFSMKEAVVDLHSGSAPYLMWMGKHFVNWLLEFHWSKAQGRWFSSRILIITNRVRFPVLYFLDYSPSLQKSPTQSLNCLDLFLKKWIIQSFSVPFTGYWPLNLNALEYVTRGKNNTRNEDKIDVLWALPRDVNRSLALSPSTWAGTCARNASLRKAAITRQLSTLQAAPLFVLMPDGSALVGCVNP